MNRPLALVCYICGREFGTKSLAFHIKACEKKWENEQNLKPPKQRRPCPQPPPGLGSLLGKDSITKNDIQQFNVKSFDSYVEEALMECEYCGRKFNPDSLVRHQKACKTNPMIRKPFTNKGPMGKHSEQEQPIKPAMQNYAFKQQMMKDEGNSQLVPCRRCGRTFASDRVGKHERVCKADPVDKIKPQPKIQKKPELSKLKPNFGKQKKAKWQIQHQQLQNAMKMMRQMRGIEAKGGKISDLPPPPPSNYDHYVECRHCGRKYAADVAERHIPKCANIINKPGGIKPSRIQQKYIAGTGSGANKSSVYPQPSNNVYGKKEINTPLKPNFGTSNNYAQNSGNPFKSSFNANQVEKGNKKQTGQGLYSGAKGGSHLYNYTQGSKDLVNSSPFNGKIKASSNPKPGNMPKSSYEMVGSSFKPNLKANSRSNANKYW